MEIRFGGGKPEEGIELTFLHSSQGELLWEFCTHKSKGPKIPSSFRMDPIKHCNGGTEDSLWKKRFLTDVADKLLAVTLSFLLAFEYTLQ